jgi:hypothetical protein
MKSTTKKSEPTIRSLKAQLAKEETLRREAEERAERLDVRLKILLEAKLSGAGLDPDEMWSAAMHTASLIKKKEACVAAFVQLAELWLAGLDTGDYAWQDATFPLSYGPKERAADKRRRNSQRAGKQQLARQITPLISSLLRGVQRLRGELESTKHEPANRVILATLRTESILHAIASIEEAIRLACDVPLPE